MFVFKCFESSFFLNAHHFAKDIMQFCNNKPYIILGGLKLKPCIESDNFCICYGNYYTEREIFHYTVHLIE